LAEGKGFMSHNVVPGYQGYVPQFQREFPTTKDVPAQKYQDINVSQESMTQRSMYASNYSASHSTDAIGAAVTNPVSRRSVNNGLQGGRKGTENPIPQPGNTVVGKPIPGSSIPASRAAQNYEKQTHRLNHAVALREAYEYEKRPTHWQTSYGSNFNAWETSEKAKRDSKLRMESQKSNPSLNNLSPKNAKAIGREAVRTSYTRDFGALGSNPYDRFAANDGKRAFSRRATTAELFGGTNKGSIRVPGHTGWVPESKNNDYNLAGTEIISNTTKDNFLITYRHNVPGYTGHYPAAVVNDHGPRNPGSKATTASHVNAGLVLDSQR